MLPRLDTKDEQAIINDLILKIDEAIQELKTRDERIAGAIAVYQACLSDHGKLLFYKYPKLIYSVNEKMNELFEYEDVRRDPQVISLILDLRQVFIAIDEGREIQF